MDSRMLITYIIIDIFCIIIAYVIKNSFTTDFGGDEFIMIKSWDCSFDKQKIGEEINTELRGICRQKQKEYTLTVSVGNYTTTDCTETIQDVIGKADEALYQEKAKRKKAVVQNGEN